MGEIVIVTDHSLDLHQLLLPHVLKYMVDDGHGNAEFLGQRRKRGGTLQQQAANNEIEYQVLTDSESLNGFRRARREATDRRFTGLRVMGRHRLSMSLSADSGRHFTLARKEGF